MLKSITFKNLLSFKHETTVDFEVYKKTDLVDSVFEYKKRKVSTSHFISNFSLIYGKNNSGKTNLLEIISSVFSFIELNYKKEKTPFTRYATTDKEDIEVEIELVSSDKLYRYGFVLDGKDHVSSEWLYANIDNSKMESMFFERYFDNGNTQVHNLSGFLNDYKVVLGKLPAEKLFISFLIDLGINELESFSSIVKKVSRTFDIEKDVEDNLNFDHLEKYCQDASAHDRLTKFLQDFDTNIHSLNIETLSRDNIDRIEELSKMLELSKKEKIKGKELVDKLIEHFGVDVYNDLTKPKFVIGQKSEAEDINMAYEFSATFIDKESMIDYEIPYPNLSFGTRKLIVLLLSIIYADEGSIFIIDEIEHGFHKVLLRSFIDLLIHSIKGKRIQIIATTHEEELLDNQDISNQSKILLENNNSTQVEYLSSYKTRKHQRLSTRYLLGAFKGTPKIIGFDYEQ